MDPHIRWLIILVNDATDIFNAIIQNYDDPVI